MNLLVMRVHVAGILVVLQLVLMTPASARSPGDSRAEAELRRGQALMQKRDYEGALATFERAAEIDSSPRVRAQIAFAKLALGWLADAENDLLVVLKSPDDDWVRRNRPVLQASLDRIQSHLGNLEVTGTPHGASLQIDGARVATIPTDPPLRLKPGPLSFTVTHPGFRPLTKTTEVGARETTFERVALTPLRAIQPTVAIQPTAAPNKPSQTTTVRADGTGHLRTACWVSVAVGAALALGSVPFFIDDRTSLPGTLLAGTGAGAMIVGGGLLIAMPW
jgi:hypothetical protein